MQSHNRLLFIGLNTPRGGPMPFPDGCGGLSLTAGNVGMFASELGIFSEFLRLKGRCRAFSANHQVATRCCEVNGGFHD